MVNSDNYPSVYSAILSHFLFEYIHPFYHGNERTGRYLLAKYLSPSLSLPTVLSLSKTIADNKSSYYKAFETVENPLNHAEAISFVINLMKLLEKAQDRQRISLGEKGIMLEDSAKLLNEKQAVLSLPEMECKVLYQVI